MQKKDIETIRGLMPEWRSGRFKFRKAGGQTNRNWIVEHEGKKYFVRLPWESNVIDRKIEGKNILALSHNKKLKEILPKYFLYVLKGRNILQPASKSVVRAPDGAMVTEYIEGKALTFLLFKNPEYQKKLAEMFRIFHSSRVRFHNKYDVFRDEIEKYRLAAKKHPIYNLIGKEVSIKMEDIERKAKSYFPILENAVSTHNDFIFQNFLLGNDGRFYLLDFEYAGLSQRCGIIYDFAFLFADNLFRQPKITRNLFESFLNAAEKTYHCPFDREKIYWAAIAAILVMFWWGLVRYFSVESKKEKKYFKNYVLKRAQGIDVILSFLEKKD